MTTTDNLVYYVPVLIGDPLQGNMQAKFTPFTMGDYMSVTTKDCETCDTHYYDKTLSKSANFNHLVPQTRTVGPLYTETGLFGYDKVCFARSDDSDLCATNVFFMEVTSIFGY